MSVEDALAALTSESHGAGFITGWVAVVEWCDVDGVLSAVTVNDSVSPPWRLEGLLGAATVLYDFDEEEA